jgi:hypothetical protein
VVVRMFRHVVGFGRGVRVMALSQLVVDMGIMVHELAHQRTDDHADGAGDEAG